MGYQVSSSICCVYLWSLEGIHSMQIMLEFVWQHECFVF